MPSCAACPCSPHGCTLAAAESVCAHPAPDAPVVPDDPVEPVDPRDVAVLLGSLVDKSLVAAAPADDGEMRYRLLETVGEYAAGRLDEAGERTVVELQHLVFYRELARTTDPELRGAGQRAAIELLEREYENLRTALRRAVAARDEQEVLCLVLSLAWYWQMRDLRTDARQWSDAAAELGPDPFAPPARPAPSLHERCTDAPPPMSSELLEEARRGVRLIQLVSMDHAMDEWTTEQSMERLRVIAGTYRTGQPQTCRAPASLWFFAVLLTGDVGKLRELLDETVRSCREFGYEWELAAALQMRANVLANRPDWAGEARGTPTRAWRSSTGSAMPGVPRKRSPAGARPMRRRANTPARRTTSSLRSAGPSSWGPAPRCRFCAPGTPPC